MALDIKTLKGKMQKSPASNKFDQADKVLADNPGGLPVQSFSAESAILPSGSVVVPIDRISDNPYNARHVYDDARVRELAISIAANGQLVAANAVPHPSLPGHFILIDGHYRKRAMAVAGKTEMRLDVSAAVKNVQMFKLSREINISRSDQTAYDDAISFRALLDGKEVDSERAIAELIGESEANVNKTLSILKLPEPVLEKIRANPYAIGMTKSYDLYLLSQRMPIEQLLPIVDQALEGELSSRDLQEMSKKLANKPERKKKETSRQYKIAQGSYAGSLKEWDSGKVVLELNIADEATRLSLLSELKAKFQIH